MRCEVTSSEAINVLLSREFIVPTYKHVCRGEQKKVNLGYNNYPFFKVENNNLIPDPEKRYPKGNHTLIAQDWEVLSTFFNIYQIVPTWLNCGFSWGYYDEEDGSWKGCIGKVKILLMIIKLLYL